MRSRPIIVFSHLGQNPCSRRCVAVCCLMLLLHASAANPLIRHCIILAYLVHVLLALGMLLLPALRADPCSWYCVPVCHLARQAWEQREQRVRVPEKNCKAVWIVARCLGSRPHSLQGGGDSFDYRRRYMRMRRHQRRGRTVCIVIRLMLVLPSIRPPEPSGMQFRLIQAGLQSLFAVSARDGLVAIGDPALQLCDLALDLGKRHVFKRGSSRCGGRGRSGGWDRASSRWSRRGGRSTSSIGSRSNQGRIATPLLQNR